VTAQTLLDCGAPRGLERAARGPRGTLQKAVVALTAAQVEAMYAAPVSILPAPAAGQVLVIDQIIMQTASGTVIVTVFYSIITLS
jgi:hypothetical protein